MLEIKHLCSHVRKGQRGHPQIALNFKNIFPPNGRLIHEKCKMLDMNDSITLRFDGKLVGLKRHEWIGPKQVLGTLARQDLVSCQIDILISAACRNEDFHDHILINSLNLSSLEGKNSSHLLTINFKSQSYLSRNCVIALLDSRR